jgi:hypothetical protein
MRQKLFKLQGKLNHATATLEIDGPCAASEMVLTYPPLPC